MARRAYRERSASTQGKNQEGPPDTQVPEGPPLMCPVSVLNEVDYPMIPSEALEFTLNSLRFFREKVKSGRRGKGMKYPCPGRTTRTVKDSSISDTPGGT